MFDVKQVGTKPLSVKNPTNLEAWYWTQYLENGNPAWLQAIHCSTTDRSRIQCKLVIPSRFISWKSHFLIVAGSAFYQIWLGRLKHFNSFTKVYHSTGIGACILPLILLLSRMGLRIVCWAGRSDMWTQVRLQDASLNIVDWWATNAPHLSIVPIRMCLLGPLWAEVTSNEAQ